MSAAGLHPGPDRPVSSLTPPLIKDEAIARNRMGRFLSAALLSTFSATVVWQASARTPDRPPVVRAVQQQAQSAVQQAVEVLRASVPASLAPPARLVWEGADIDGDGAADFLNPTGLSQRAHDAFGSGAYGASRDGGARQHAGVDYEAIAGAEVKAPMSGFITKIGQAYGDDPHLRYVEITNPALKHTARVLYLSPEVEVGQALAMGQTIGRVETLQGRYPGITDHVHLEISAHGAGKRDPGSLITARLER